MATAAAQLSNPHAKGLISSLFDLSFTSFITTKIIKLLYVISMVSAACVALAMMAPFLVFHAGSGFLMLLLSPVAFLLIVAYSRVLLEVAVVFFRIEEHTAQFVRMEDSRRAAGTSPN